MNPTLSFCCAFPVGMNASITAINTTAVSQRLTFPLIAACTSGLVSYVLGFWATVRLDSPHPPANRHFEARQRRGRAVGSFLSLRGTECRSNVLSRRQI